jgi:hypothetical protein
VGFEESDGLGGGEDEFHFEHEILFHELVVFIIELFDDFDVEVGEL